MLKKLESLPPAFLNFSIRSTRATAESMISGGSMSGVTDFKCLISITPIVGDMRWVANADMSFLLMFGVTSFSIFLIAFFTLKH